MRSNSLILLPGTHPALGFPVAESVIVHGLQSVPTGQVALTEATKSVCACSRIAAAAYWAFAWICACTGWKQGRMDLTFGALLKTAPEA